MIKTKSIFETKNPFINKRRKDLFEKLSFFRNNIYEPKHVFYPCCCDNLVPIYAFPKSKVTFLDKDDSLYDLMNEEGANFILADIDRYEPKPHDLTLILNPLITSKSLEKGLVYKGYIISNDYHGNVRKLSIDDSYTFIGLINRNKENELKLKDVTQFGSFGDNLHVFQKIKE